MQLTLGDVLVGLGKTTYQRGLDYANAGKVLAIEHNGDFIEGIVSGADHRPYKQSIEIRQQGKIHAVDIDGECSCPVSYNCKHVAAVLIACLTNETRRFELSANPPVVINRQAEKIPAPVMEWVNRLGRAMTSAPDAVPLQMKKGTVYRLLFALTPIPYSQKSEVALSICKARLRNGGEIGGTEVVRDFQRLLFNPPAYVSADDIELIQMMTAMRSGMVYYAQNYEISGKLGAHILRMLLDANRLYWANSSTELMQGKVFLLQPGPVRRAELFWKQEKTAVKLAWRLPHQGASTDSAREEAFSTAHILSTEPPLYVDVDLLACGEAALLQEGVPLSSGQLQALVQQAPAVHVDNKEAVTRLLLTRGLAEVVPLPHQLPETTRHDVAVKPVLALRCMEFDGMLFDVAQLAFDYDDQRCIPSKGGEPTVIVRQTDAGIEKIVRQSTAEKQAHDTLTQLGFAPSGDDYLQRMMPDVLTLPSQAEWIRFDTEQLPLLVAQGWRIEKHTDYRFNLAKVEDWYAAIGDDADEPGHQWFDLELGVVVNGERVSLLPVLVDLIRNAPHDFNAQALAGHPDDDLVLAALPDGTRVALPWVRIKPILSTLGELYFTEKSGSAIRLSTLDAGRLAELEGVTQLRWLGGQRVRKLGQKISQFGGIETVTLPQGLQATLRPYQIEGVAWLQFLRQYDLAGILADDMGLGKTVQTLTHLLIEKESGRMTQPVLVIAPTSLMGNWQDEAARFAPALRVLILQGKDRLSQFERIDQFDIVLTTYALLPRDEDKLRRHDYYMVILDEAHYIKNARSKAAQVAGLLNARHRLCLTGTPLENHLGELWSQFHFLLPGLLGDDKSFNRDFRTPIEKHGDDTRRRLLLRRLKPFILRRTKDKVAKELPPKTEMVRTVEITGAQRDLYETVRLAMDKKVRTEIAKKGVARSQIIILEALLKLRQVCCDPRLVKTTDAKKIAAPSAKLSELMEMLESLLEDGRRILLFSQFTSMLALIEDELKARKIAYALLTGDTDNRADVVRSFQEGKVPLFLISLKAGGVGLNLTAADTVIHYDPWWNPAVENQATDRAWRIGQDKPVFVYKLIAKGTLEEKIQALQQKKAELAHAILDGGEAGKVKLTQEDLQAIFAPLDA